MGQCAEEELAKNGLKPPSSPFRPPPTKLDPTTIQRIVRNGHLDELQARELFDRLDSRHHGKLSVQNIVTVLMSVEHFGALEDKNGTLKRIEMSRAIASTPLPNLTEEQRLQQRPVTPREREQQMRAAVRQKEEAALLRQAEGWAHRYGRTERGFFTFDEFCVLLLQLCRTL